MADRNDQTMNESESLLILNDDCVMEIFERLALLDFVNLADTCSRLRNVACHFSSRKYKKIEVNSYVAPDRKVAMRKLSKILSKIGEHVLEVDVNVADLITLRLIKEKCKNLESIAMIEWRSRSVLQGFQNLKKFKLICHVDISLNEWKNFVTSNPELDVLEYFGRYRNGFIELLTHLPKLKTLMVPPISKSLHQRPDFQHLFQLTGLTKLSLCSMSCNLNGILVDLAKCMMNLVELNIEMDFDGDSLEIIKMFRNLEVLSMEQRWQDWNEAWLPNATVFPSRLQRLKINNISISCWKFLQILQHLNFLEELDLGNKGKIHCDDNSKVFFISKIKNVVQNVRRLFLVSAIDFKESQAMVIKRIEQALIRNGRDLKIFRCDYEENSLVSLKCSTQKSFFNLKIFFLSFCLSCSTYIGQTICTS